MLRPAFVRFPVLARPTLFAGPWVGEFGWELMNWQGFLRKISKRYRRIIVCCREGHEILYGDFCDEFVVHRLQGVQNSHVLRDLENPEELKRVLSLVPSDADVLRPLQYVPRAEQAFIRFGRARDDLRTDVLVHARNRALDEQRNWPRARWLALLSRLHDSGLRVAAIGLSAETLDLDGSTDYRDLPLRETLDVLASSRLLIGPSSGPMHLAALCATPHLVWTDRRTYGMRKTSREKYESSWNPLRTEAMVIDNQGFDVSVDRAWSEAKAFFERSHTSRGGTTRSDNLESGLDRTTPPRPSSQ